METETRETARLIASDRVEGTSVYGPDGEKLGHVERFMVDKMSGQAEYAVLSFGGLFGIGDRHYPLPWQALTYDTDRGGYIVNVTRDQIEGAPNYEREEPVYDQPYGQEIYAYYGVAWP